MSDTTYTELDVVASLCRESFADFVREFWDVIITDKLSWNWHMDVLCSELQTIAERIFLGLPRLYDLVINVPPATTKSTIASVMFPAWMWTRMPHCRVIGASYSYSLAADLSRKSRDIVKSDKYQACFPEVRIREDQDAKAYFVNTKHGDRFTASVNGMVTGMHGHLIICDDPLDPEQAFSEAELKIANRWMTHTLPSRKVDKSLAPIVLIHQRLHANDPTGEMLEKAKRQGAFPVRHIRIPADDSFPVQPSELEKFYINGLMDPKRLPRNVLDAERANSEYSYRSQYGQDPQPASGSMFKLDYFRQTVKAAPYKAARIRYFDRASTSASSVNATTAAFTAGVLMAKADDGNWYVEHVVHGQWEPDERNRVIRATAERDRAKYGENEPVVWIEREGGSSGRDAWKGVARALAGFVVKEDAVSGRKEVRAEPWACQLAAGNVFLVADGTWDIARYIDEHCLFPNGRLKDLVDASSGAFNLLTSVKRIQGLRVIKLTPRKSRDTIRLIVCTEEHLPYLPSDRMLLVSLGDRWHNTPPDCDRAEATLSLGFCDLDPADFQDTWQTKVEAYNDLPENLMLRKEEAKRLWKFLFEKREAAPRDIVFVERDSTRRAATVALAVCDTLRLSREKTLIDSASDDKMTTIDPPNRHVYKVIKSARAAVVG